MPSTLRTVWPDGSPGRVLARPDVGIPDAEFTPDGTAVAMILGREPSRIVWLDLASGERSRVIGSSDLADTRSIHSLGVSPTGDRLVFCALPSGAGTLGLFTVGIDGSDVARISDGHEDCQPDWGPNDRIAAESIGARSRIVTMNPDGSDRQIVIRSRDADGAAIFSSPSWSPDGGRIVVGSTSFEGTHPDLWIVDTDGSNLSRLTRTPNRAEFAPIFSPDGAHIAFLRAGGNRSYPPSDIYTMSTDGTDVRQVTDTPNKRELPRSWQALVTT